MKKVLLIFGFIWFSMLTVLEGQVITPRRICRLPEIINESSGIEYHSRSVFYTHNDSGDKPVIYEVDTFGVLRRTIKLLNVTATDFEDITRDDKGNLYIGDFGNNASNRTDLKIYKIPPPETLLADSVIPEIIYFSYPDQFQFPPDSSMLNFDCESMICYHNSLYLFSKNHGLSTFCRMYSLPVNEGVYVASLLDSFDTHHWITSADINNDGSAMVLLSESRIWLFTEFNGNNFFNSKTKELEIPFTQKEGVVFISDNELYLTDEREDLVNGYLYYIDLQDYIPKIVDSFPGFSISPNPSVDVIHLKVKLPGPTLVNFRMFNITGQKVFEKNLEYSSGSSESEISIQELSSGVYFIELLINGTRKEILKVVKD